MVNVCFVSDQFCSNNGTNPPTSQATAPAASTSGKKDVSTAKDTVILKWCTPKNSTPNGNNTVYLPLSY